MTRPNENYLKYVRQVSPKSKHLKSCVIAFIIGGFICIIGQAIGDMLKYFYPDMTPETVGSLVSGILIFIGASLTGIGVYDQIGSFAGAGSLVPITGFANSVVSPAIEFKSEGYVYGVAAKMFTVAGPIIVNGATLAALVGIIYYIIGLF